MEPGIGISAVSAFGIEAAILTLMIAGILCGATRNIELGGQNMSSYIEVRNVSKSFSGRAILQNISLSVEQGTTVGFGWR